MFERNTARILVLALVTAGIGVSTYVINAVGDSCVRHHYSDQPAFTVDTAHGYQATIRTTRGTLFAELYPQEAPKTVANFVYLSQNCFYNGLSFYKVKDWLAQTGDPTNTGLGGAGYTLRDEISALPYKTGALVMANSGPNSDSSQFFILKEDVTTLAHRYTVFGYLTFGVDTLTRIQQGDVIQGITIQDLGPTPEASP